MEVIWICEQEKEFCCYLCGRGPEVKLCGFGPKQEECSCRRRVPGSVPGWMDLGAAWSSGNCPCPWQGFGIKWSGRFLPTQTVPGFYTDKIPVPSETAGTAWLFSIIPEQQGPAPLSLLGVLSAALPARRAGSGGGTAGGRLKLSRIVLIGRLHIAPR